MSPEPISPRSIERTLAAARDDARRLFVKQRALFAASMTGMALVGARGLLAIAAPARSGAPLVAVALGLVLAAAGVTFGAALRARLRMERLARDIHALEVVLDAAAHETQPRVEIRPYRADGDVATFVVRTDALADLAAEATARSSRVASSSSSSRSSERWMMAGWGRRAIAALAVAGAVIAAAGFFLDHGGVAKKRWTFLEETTDPSEVGFAALAGDASRAGAWLLADHDTATGARALVNRAGEDAAPPATLLVGSVTTRDVRAGTRCKVAVPEGEGCGLVFRYRDARDHHVVRLDFTGRRLVIARVVGGEEHELGSVAARIDGAVWQEISVQARGDRIRATCNNRDVLEVVDHAAALPGSVGLWAPSAAEAYFDELSIETLTASPQALEILPVLGKAGAS